MSYKKKLFYVITALCFISSLIFVTHNASFYERPIAKVTKTTLEHQSDVQLYVRLMFQCCFRHFGNRALIKRSVVSDENERADKTKRCYHVKQLFLVRHAVSVAHSFVQSVFIIRSERSEIFDWR